MKTAKHSLVVLAAGLTASLVSCVDPYYGGAVTTSATVTHYRPGYVVQTLPPHYETVVYGGVPYYHYNNVYYRSHGGRYIVVEAPHHSRAWSHRDRYRRASRHDWYDNRYDRHDDRDRNYDRDERQTSRYRGRTRMVRTLPNGAQVVTHRGNRYYRAGDTYYQARGDGYVIVERPR
jgi:hypothetical protein